MKNIVAQIVIKGFVHHVAFGRCDKDSEKNVVRAQSRGIRTDSAKTSGTYQVMEK
jgi:hypothetical protein